MEDEEEEEVRLAGKKEDKTFDLLLQALGIALKVGESTALH